MAFDKFSFKIDVTKRRVIVYFCDNVVESVQTVMKGMNPDGLECCDAITFGTDTGNSVVFFQKNPPLDIIVHETYHITNDVSVAIGIIPSSDTEEYFAYLNQMIFKKIYEYVQKKYQICEDKIDKK